MIPGTKMAVRRKALMLAMVLVGLAGAVTAPLLSPVGGRTLPPTSLAPLFDGLDLRPGDVVFRRGRSLESYSVLAMDRESPFSHVGLIRIANGTVRVVHALPPEGDNDVGGIVNNRLDAFLATDRASRAAIYRLNPPDYKTAALAADAAYRFALAGLPFDATFDANDKGALYCTELVWAAYREAGVDLVGDDFVELRSSIRNGSFILPSTLTKSRHLKLLRTVSR